jgi:hypothetical protein
MWRRSKVVAADPLRPPLRTLEIAPRQLLVGSDGSLGFWWGHSEQLASSEAAVDGDEMFVRVAHLTSCITCDVPVMGWRLPSRRLCAAYHVAQLPPRVHAAAISAQAVTWHEDAPIAICGHQWPPNWRRLLVAWSFSLVLLLVLWIRIVSTRHCSTAATALTAHALPPAVAIAPPLTATRALDRPHQVYTLISITAATSLVRARSELLATRLDVDEWYASLLYTLTLSIFNSFVVVDAVKVRGSKKGGGGTVERWAALTLFVTWQVVLLTLMSAPRLEERLKRSKGQRLLVRKPLRRLHHVFDVLL